MAQDLKKNATYKGYETWFSNLHMAIKMHLHLMLGIGVLHLVVTILVASTINFGGENLAAGWRLLFSYLIDCVTSLRFPLLGSVKGVLSWLIGKTLLTFAICSPTWALYPAALRMFKKRADTQSADIYIEGAKIVSEDELNKQIAAKGEQCRMKLGGCNLPVKYEPYHGMIFGGIGMGKTQQLLTMLTEIRRIKGKAVIYDFKGDLTSILYNPEKDYIFNPLDARGVPWNIFSDVRSQMDIEALAHSLVPESISNVDPFWPATARAVFGGTLRHLKRIGEADNEQIWEFIAGDIAHISAMLGETPGAEAGFSAIQDAGGKQALSVISTLMTHASAFKFMPACRDSKFSLADWIQQEGDSFMFLTSYSDIEATLKPILSLAVDLIALKILSLSDDRQRRRFFMLDEFGTLQRLPSIQRVLLTGRSKGVSAWLGFQDVGQIDKLYTHQVRSSIINACSNRMFFGVGDPDTAEFVSKAIGDVKLSKVQETYSMGPEDSKDGISQVRQEKIERAVMASTIMRLPELTAYVSIPGCDIARTTFKGRGYPTISEPFVLRDGLSLDEVEASQAQLASKFNAVVPKVEMEEEATTEKDEKTKPKKAKDKYDDDISIGVSQDLY